MAPQPRHNQPTKTQPKLKIILNTQKAAQRELSPPIDANLDDVDDPAEEEMDTQPAVQTRQRRVQRREYLEDVDFDDSQTLAEEPDEDVEESDNDQSTPPPSTFHPKSKQTQSTKFAKLEFNKSGSHGQQPTRSSALHKHLPKNIQSTRDEEDDDEYEDENMPNEQDDEDDGYNDILDLDNINNPDMVLNKNGLIIKPPGEAGRGRLAMKKGFNLRRAMGFPLELSEGHPLRTNPEWKKRDKLFSSYRDYARILATRFFKDGVIYSQQSNGRKSAAIKKFHVKFPRFRHYYADNWPLVQFWQINLQYRKNKSRTQAKDDDKEGDDDDDNDNAGVDEVDVRPPGFRKAITPPRSALKKAKAAKRKRVEDDSDEDDPAPRKAKRKQAEDDSDEEVPAPRKTKAAKKKQVDDSSDDEEPPRPKKQLKHSASSASRSAPTQKKSYIDVNDFAKPQSKRPKPSSSNLKTPSTQKSTSSVSKSKQAKPQKLTWQSQPESSRGSQQEPASKPRRPAPRRAVAHDFDLF
ncbi:hypothetical protein FRC02_004347 [Tulasnella sp. 418]|nr:hypothetical protein FRC02_004347 [Tulasnella sp. 418]